MRAGYWKKKVVIEDEIRKDVKQISGKSGDYIRFLLKEVDEIRERESRLVAALKALTGDKQYDGMLYSARMRLVLEALAEIEKLDKER